VGGLYLVGNAFIRGPGAAVDRANSPPTNHPPTHMEGVASVCLGHFPRPCVPPDCVSVFGHTQR